MAKTLALRPYLATIEQYCRSLDREALQQLVLDLARDVKSHQRGDFLDKVLGLAGGSGISGSSSPDAAGQRGLLADIETLQQEISSRIESIEDGSYWEDPDEDYDGYWDDEPDLISAAQQDELAALFAEGEQLYIRGDKEGAAPVYKALFSLLDAAGYENLDGCRLNLKEERARYARCVYELSPEKGRAQAVLSAIGGGFGDSDDSNSYGWYDRNLPLLQDVIDAETGDLSGFETFLSAWLEVLRREDIHRKRTADLLLEAGFFKGGLNEVGRLARKWQGVQPEGYLYWLARLEELSSWREAGDVANEALSVLPPGRDRQKAAAYLVRAGENLGDDVMLLSGYRERFRSEPSLAGLLELVREAGRQEVRQAELQSICAFLGDRKSEYNEKSLLVSALLMAGALDQAFSLSEQAKAVGWSGGSTGLLFSGILHLAAGSNPDCTAIDILLKMYSSDRLFFFDTDVTEDSRQYEQLCYQEIVAGLAMFAGSAADLEKYLLWARDIGEERINHIVSNKHRGAYGRAAGVLVSLAEVLTAKGEKEQARSFLQSYCLERYNRHRAFRQEVRKSVGDSRILRGMGRGL